MASIEYVSGPANHEKISEEPTSIWKLFLRLLYRKLPWQNPKSSLQEHGGKPLVYKAKAYHATYEKLRLLGAGTFGDVFLCQHVHTQQFVAIKKLEKKKLFRLQQVQRTLTEKRILTLSHPFITKLYSAFETHDNLYLVLEYCPGGDLYTLLEREESVHPDAIAFFVASIVLVLQHLHSHNIIYRDLKPENILLDAKGFVRLADFGLAKEHMYENTKTSSMCGSAEYIAPEVLLGEGYTKAADLWSLGCLVFELSTGVPPFYAGQSRSVLFQNIKTAKVTYPSSMSCDAIDFVHSLLQRDPDVRLGSHSYQQIFQHPFLASINWYALATMHIRPPYVPFVSAPFDTKYFCKSYTRIKVNGFIAPTLAHNTTFTQSSSSGTFHGFDWHHSDHS